MRCESETGNPKIAWLLQDAVDDSRMPAGLHPLLTETGSLTERLRAGCREGFAVQVLRQGWCKPGDYIEHELDTVSSRGLLREVYLRCDNRPVVFAQTLIPETTLAAHPWLAELGDKPLGLALFARDDVSRRPFEFAELSMRHELAVRAAAGLENELPDGRRLWARRSLFMVADLPVSVNEVFFPPLPSTA